MRVCYVSKYTPLLCNSEWRITKVHCQRNSHSWGFFKIGVLKEKNTFNTLSCEGLYKVNSVLLQQKEEVLPLASSPFQLVIVPNFTL